MLTTLEKSNGSRSKKVNDRKKVPAVRSATVAAKIPSAVVTELRRLDEAFRNGELEERAETALVAGQDREILEYVNGLVQTLSEKVDWYKAIVDAVPFPVHVIDKNMNWTFLNKAFEKLMVGQGYVKNRDEAVGMPCSTANANICNTSECGIRRLQRGIGDSFFDWCGMSCKQDTSHVLNVKGEQVGFVEVVQDLTPTIRVKDYTSSEVGRLEKNLTLLASGDLNFDLEVEKADKHTTEVEQQFKKINNNLVQVKNAVGGLIGDADHMTQNAIEGKLDTRVDVSKHNGDFQKVVQGLNQTLDAVVGPLNTAAQYVDQISKGKIPAKITDSYNGDFNTIKDNLNACIDGLGGLVESNKVLQLMAVNDHSAEVSGAYQGIFAEVAQATNLVQERLRSATEVCVNVGKGDYKADLVDFRKIGKRSENDTLVPAFIQMMESIDMLNRDASMLSEQAVAGHLAARADASQHQGEYRKVIEGINATLDAVVVPLTEVTVTLEKLADGDLTARVDKAYAGDLAKVCKAVNTVSIQVGGALQQIAENVSSLMTSAEELNALSQQMSASSDQTAVQANVVSAASEQVAVHVQTVATGADEMGASINEIAKNTSEATKVAMAAVKTAEATNQTISKLGQSSSEIGQVIKVITSIAQQTNLLALNATIEAARAGEAGKGFAVVANEVKELAKETAKATEDISRKIEAIQSDTKGAVSAIEQIGNVITQISDIQTTIASAVEEQSATTSEISRNLTEASQGAQDITKNIAGVAEAAKTTTAGVSDMQKSAQGLEMMAADLKALVSQFKY